MATDGISSTGSSPSSGSNSNPGLRDLSLDTFLTLMITELQNQDPLNPLENDQILQQISQIREIEASTQMQETLQAVLLGQNLSNANTLLDRTVTALTNDNVQITGKVDRVSVADNDVLLHIGSQSVKLTNVREVVATP